MKFSILSGAIKNAGDFLIAERSIQLLKYVYTNCDIKIYNRNQSLEDKLEEINASDALVFAGGPVFLRDMYPDNIPLISELSLIRPRIFTIGLGWFGRNSLDNTIYKNYKFNASTLDLINRMNASAVISCRDWDTIRVLKNQGFNNLIMTGCPAWYDLENIDTNNLRKGINIPYRKICISDSGYLINIPRSYEVARYVREKYPDAQVDFIFHRGIAQDENTSETRGAKNEELANKLRKLNINVHDISYSSEGFNIYDDCDIHIGFRVHAHIYNLSKRNISVLIEEDARSIGTNEALGLYGVKPYNYRMDNRTNEIFLDNNEFFIDNLDDCLFMLEKNDYSLMEQAYHIQQIYFETMIKHIKNISI